MSDNPWIIEEDTTDIIETPTSKVEEVSPITAALPVKKNEALREPSIYDLSKEYVGGTAEAVASLATYAGAGIAGVVASIGPAINMGINKAFGTKLPDDVAGMQNFVSENLPKYTPKTNFGQEALKGTGEILETVDLAIRDGVDWTYEHAIKSAQDAQESITGVRPDRIEAVDNATKAVAYAGLNLIGLQELSSMIKGGVKITSAIKSKLTSQGIPKELQDAASVYSDIYDNVPNNAVEYRIGRDTRTANKVVLDSLDIKPEYHLTDAGVEWSELLAQRGLKVNNAQDRLGALYDAATPDQEAIVGVKEVYAPKYKDITSKDVSVAGTVQFLKEQVTPPYFLQGANPVIKRLYDWSRKLKSDIDYEVEDLLYGTRFARGFLNTGKFSERQIGLSTLAGSRTVPSEDGALFEWMSLPVEQQAQVIRRLAELSDAKITHENTIKVINTSDRLNEQQKQAAIKLINLPKSEFEKYNITAQTVGAKQLSALKSVWMPRFVSGNFILRIDAIENGTRTKLLRKGFETEAEANKFLRNEYDFSKAEGVKYDYSIKSTSPEYDIREQAFAAMQQFGEESGIDTSVISKYLDKVSKQKSFMAARGAKRNVWGEGYDYDPKYAKNDKELVRNFEKSYLASIRGLVKNRTRLYADKEFNEITSNPGVATLYPNSVAAGIAFREKAFGKRTSINQGLENAAKSIFSGVSTITGDVIKPSSVAKTVPMYGRAINFLGLLAGNSSYLIANAVTPYLVGATHGAMLESRGLQNSITKSSIQSLYDLHVHASPEIREVLNFYTKESRLAKPSFYQQFTFSDEHGISLSKKQGIDWWGAFSGEKIALKQDEYTRAQAGLITYHQLRDAGVSHEVAMRSSAYAAQNLMVDYSNLEKANIYNNTISGVLGKYNTWGQNAVALQIQYLKEIQRQTANISDPLAKARMTKLAAVKGFEIVAIGAAAGFGITYIDSLLKATGADSTLAEDMRQEAPDWITYGIPQALTGTRVPSLGSPDVLGPSTVFLDRSKELIQSFAGVVNDEVSLPKYLIKRALGTADPHLLPSKDEIGRLYKAVSPKPAHAFIDSWLASSNAKGEGGTVKFWNLEDNTLYELPDTKHYGNVFSFVTKQDLFKKAFGLMSIEEHKTMIDFMRVRRKEEKSKDEYDHLVKRTATFLETGLDVPAPYQNKLSDLRVDVKVFRKDIKNQVESDTITALLRAASANRLSAKTIRALEELEKTNPQLVKKLQEQVEKSYQINKAQQVEQKSKAIESIPEKVQTNPWVVEE